jgi:ParB family chromosome partitioning protein
MEEQIGEVLGTKVQITQGKKKGKIEIEYYGTEDLERILELIMN